MGNVPAVPAEIAAWLACLAFLVWLTNGLLQFRSRMAGDKRTLVQPFEVKASIAPAAESDCRERHQADADAVEKLRRMRDEDLRAGSLSRKALYDEIGGIRAEMADMERRINAADESRSQALHDRINDILSAVSELRGEVNRGLRK